jgi:hypothetical protein
MNKKLITYFIPVFIGTIIILGIVYFVSLFWRGDDKKEAKLDEFKGKTEIFSSKKEAYDTFINDSIVNVHKENVSVNLNSLFSSKGQDQPQELITEDETPRQELSEVSSTKREEAPVKSRQSAKNYSPTPVNHPREEVKNVPKTFEEDPTTVKEKKQQRRESFNSFSQSANTEPSPDKPTFIKAVVHSKQTVYNGSTVKLRAVTSFALNGVAIPENTIVYGVVSMLDERVMIHVNSINLNSSIVAVALRAYDRDGMEGVYIPGLAGHELKNESVDQAISEAQTVLNVPHVASGVLNVARSRNRLTTAILTDNYQLVLK